MDKFVHRNVRTGELLTTFDSKQRAAMFSQTQPMPEQVGLFHMTEEGSNVEFEAVSIAPAS